MTKRIKKMHIIMISILLAVVCGLFYCMTYYQKPTQQMQVATRNIEVTKNALDCQAIFDSFEDSKVEIVDNITSFEGVKTFNLADFAELDLLSNTNANENLEIKVKYDYTYNSQTNIVTMTVSEVGEDGIEIIDTLQGVAFVNEDGELDAVFDCDGECLLLSELQDAEQIQNCGWFKKALKKIKKVVSNPVGVIGAIATVAVPAVIGVVAAVAAAPIVATIAVGAVVGAGIAAGTAAASTYIQDGKVDWEAVGICAGVGAVVGGAAAGIAHGVTSAMTQISNAIKNVDANKRTHILQDKHEWSRIGDNTWDTASEAIKHTLKNGSASAYKAGNEIVTATYKGQTVQVVVRKADNVLRIVDAWIKLL